MFSPAVPGSYHGSTTTMLPGSTLSTASLYPGTPGGPLTPRTPATPASEGSGIVPQLQFVFSLTWLTHLN